MNYYYYFFMLLYHLGKARRGLPLARELQRQVLTGSKVTLTGLKRVNLTGKKTISRQKAFYCNVHL